MTKYEIILYWSDEGQSFSDAHGALVEIVAQAEARDPGTAKHVLVETVSAVHHLCDQYDLNYEGVLAEASDLHRYQQGRDLKNLESGE